MRGRIICGYAVTELLGSGRSGLLYLLREPSTNRKAVLRVVTGRDVESGAYFEAEALRFLPPSLTHHMVHAALDDGTPVELLVAPEPTAKRPRSRLVERLAEGQNSWALGVWRAAWGVAMGLLLASLVVLGLRSRPVSQEPATLQPEAACSMDARWRLEVLRTIEVLDQLSQAGHLASSVYRSRRRSLLHMVASAESGDCHETTIPASPGARNAISSAQP